MKLLRLSALHTGHLYHSKKYSCYSFLLEVESIAMPIMQQEGLCQWKFKMTPSGNRTRDLPAYSAVPQPGAPNVLWYQTLHFWPHPVTFLSYIWQCDNLRSKISLAIICRRFFVTMSFCSSLVSVRQICLQAVRFVVVGKIFFFVTFQFLSYFYLRSAGKANHENVTLHNVSCKIKMSYQRLSCV
jgi:hypothetical protein